MKLDKCECVGCHDFASWWVKLALPCWPKPETKLVCSGHLGTIETLAAAEGGSCESRPVALTRAAQRVRRTTRTWKPVLTGGRQG